MANLGSAKRRIEDLEQQAEAAGRVDGPDIVISAGDVFIVHGERLTRAEFYARYPGYKPTTRFSVGGLDLLNDI